MHFIEISLGSIMSSAANPWRAESGEWVWVDNGWKYLCWEYNWWQNCWRWYYALIPDGATMQPKPEAPRDKRSKRDTNSRSPSRYGPKRSHDGSSYSGSRSKCNPGNSSSSSAPRTLDLPEELRGAIVTRKENL